MPDETPLPDGPAVPPTEEKKKRSPWMWATIVLGVVAVGLLIWALTTRSDLDSAEDDVQNLQGQVQEGNQETEAAKAAADDLAKDLGATNEDLDQTEQQLDQAEQSAAQAEQDAAAAKKAAEDAANATEKAQAESDEANAEADAAEAEKDTATGCASAYLSALGGLFEGESVKDQAPIVREELDSISAQCSGVLG